MTDQNDTASPAFLKPFEEDRRSGRRRVNKETWDAPERRCGQERRLDADWRFALLRRHCHPEQPSFG